MSTSSSTEHGWLGSTSECDQSTLLCVDSVLSVDYVCSVVHLAAGQFIMSVFVCCVVTVDPAYLLSVVLIFCLGCVLVCASYTLHIFVQRTCVDVKQIYQPLSSRILLLIVCFTRSTAATTGSQSAKTVR